MVLYEALTSSGSPTNSRSGSSSGSNLLLKLLALALAGPRRLLVLQQDRKYARGGNEAALTRTATVSLATWCCLFLVGLVGRNSNTRQWIVQQVTRVGRTALRAVLNHQQARKKYNNNKSTQTTQNNDDDRTITQHQGSCQCGAVQFQVRLLVVLWNILVLPVDSCLLTHQQEGSRGTLNVRACSVPRLLELAGNRVYALILDQISIVKVKATSLVALFIFLLLTFHQFIFYTDQSTSNAVRAGSRRCTRRQLGTHSVSANCCSRGRVCLEKGKQKASKFSQC